MMVWRDILQPIHVTVDQNCTLRQAVDIVVEQNANLVLVRDQTSYVGYVDTPSLLGQLRSAPDMMQTIHYKHDILKVPEDHPVEFFHNISVILGVNRKGEVTGFSTLQTAMQKLNQLKLEQMNQILNGAGIGIIHTNQDFNITFINETAESILGLSRTFLIGRNYKTLLTIDKDLDEILTGKRFVSVNCSLNFKTITGNFSPLVIDGKMAGIVHIFYLREQWEETVQELDFVRSMYEDLQAIYSSSQEQVMVVCPAGKIIRLAGCFLKEFWEEESPEQIIGRNVKELEQKGFFRPNIFDMCKKKGSKLTSIQETVKGRRVWSVATPVFHDGKLKKLIIISRDITEINQLREKLQMARRQTDEYKQELAELSSQHEKKKLIYRSRIMEHLVDEMRQIASVDSTVLLYGESGVGKEVFAHSIHQSSKRKDKPFIRVNCGAIPENLIESELFGYERGAFTGADQKGKPGLFELADQGTIFLDEITELPLNMQVKLLRILQEKEITRIGGVKTIRVNVRVIAATNQNMRELVQAGKFREDLYYRLNVIPLHIPPLRERVEDILPLSIHFLQQFNRTYQKEKSLSREAVEVLENYNWPGNVRELHNVMERLAVTTKKDFISRDDVLSVLYGDMSGKRVKPFVYELMPLKEAVAELESQMIQLALQKYGTAAKVSEVLGVSQATVSRRIHKLLK